jgi:hypothetical protein
MSRSTVTRTTVGQAGVASADDRRLKRLHRGPVASGFLPKMLVFELFIASVAISHYQIQPEF